MTSKEWSAISLFSGMGGDTLGMERAGVHVIAFNEFEPAAMETHMLNFPNSIRIMDEGKKKVRDQNNIQLISDEKFESYQGKVDIIFAGHPCQGFSNGGKKLPNDPRNTLFREFARVSRLVKPDYIIGENVDGLLNRKTATGENYMEVIIDEFNRIGYDITYKVCHAVQYGVPQLRKRLVYVGVKKEMKRPYVFPEPLNDGKSNLPDLKNIIRFDMSGSIEVVLDDFDMSSLPEECILTDMNNTETEDTDNIHPYLRLKVKTRNESYNGKTHHSLISFSKRDSPIHSEIIDIRKPSKTIICTYDHQPRLYVPLRNKNGYFLRCILPDELKQIQGFPSDFQLNGKKKDKIKQIGNAAPPPLVEQIVRSIVK